MDDPRLQELAPFTHEGKLTPGYGEHYLFFVGRDDVHSLLLHLIQNEKLAFRLNMFSYDDDELASAIVGLFNDPNIYVQISLDKSQEANPHEQKIIAAAKDKLGTEFANSFCVMKSATKQISHTKGGVFAGQGLWFEGSTNWSKGGEGIGIDLHGKSPHGFQAQNNTVLVSANPVGLSRFSSQLDAEHRIGVAQGYKW